MYVCMFFGWGKWRKGGKMMGRGGVGFGNG